MQEDHHAVLRRVHHQEEVMNTRNVMRFSAGLGLTLAAAWSGAQEKAETTKKPPAPAGAIKGAVVIELPDGTQQSIPFGTVPGATIQVPITPPPGVMLDGAGPGIIVRNRVKKASAASDYGIGVSIAREMPEALRSHLKLPDNAGLLVQSVAEESPAAKAGIKEHDILLQVGKAPLDSPDKLIEAVQKAGEAGEELSLEVLSSGERKNVSLTPAKSEKVAWMSPDMEARLNAHRMYEMLDSNADDAILRMRVHPGMVLPGQASNERLDKIEQRLDQLSQQLEALQDRLPAAKKDVK
jgi:membrane-associated protease RseP (regulator of RpoE activity)